MIPTPNSSADVPGRWAQDVSVDQGAGGDGEPVGHDVPEGEEATEEQYAREGEAEGVQGGEW